MNEQVDQEMVLQAVEVADDPRAHLMYYMHCVSVVLRLNNPFFRHFSDFRNYQKLDDADEKLLLQLAIKFNILSLTGQVFFRHDGLSGDTGHAFYSLRGVHDLLGVDYDVPEEGEMIIMTYAKEWGSVNWTRPSAALTLREWDHDEERHAERDAKRDAERDPKRDAERDAKRDAEHKSRTCAIL